MDKYEYQVCADQIKNYIAQQKYVEAMEIADTIDWHRVKSVSMLCTVSEIYKYNRRYEDSRDILLLAYDRHPSGRMIIYSLCELSIKMNDVVSAVEYYKEFVRVAPGDTGSYILLYKIYEAQEVSLEERIKVLEEYKRRDYKEKWAFELAKLYHKTGQESKCVDECDELILWFGEGKYVQKAMELKAQHQAFIDQQAQYAASVPQQYVPDSGQPDGEKYIPEETEQRYNYNNPYNGQQGTYNIISQEISAPGYNTEKLQNELRQSMEEYLGEPQPDIYEAGPVNYPETLTQQPGLTVEKVEPVLPEKTQEFVFDQNSSYVQQLMEEFKKPEGEPEESDPYASGQYAGEQPEEQEPEGEPEEKPEEEPKVSTEEKPEEKSEEEPEEESEGKPESEPEEKPEEKPEENPEQVTEQMSAASGEPEETAGGEGDKNEPSEPETKAEHKRYESILGQEYNGQIRMSLPDPDMIERQITGQINIEEIIRKRNERLRREAGIEVGETLSETLQSDEGASETVSEEDRTEEELSEAEPEKGVTEEETAEAEPEKATTEEETAEAEPEKATTEEETAEAEPEEAETEEETAEAEPEEAETEEEAAEAGPEEAGTEEENAETEAEAEEGMTEEEAAEAEPEEETAEEEEAEGSLFRYELDDYGEVEEIEDIEQPDEVDDIIKTSNLPLEEIASYNAMAEQAMHPESIQEHSSNYDEHGRMKHPSYMVLEEERKSRRNFDEREYKLFGRYDGIESVKAQLVDVLDNMSMQAGTGNVVVTGEEVSCRKALAIDIIKAMQAVDSSFTGKVAKISGEALNRKNIPVTLSKLYNGALIIEEAGGLSAAALTIIAQCLVREEEPVLILLEGDRDSVMPLLETNRAMFDQVFNARMDIARFSSDDLVAYAKGYAREQEHSIDEMGILALYTRIGELQTIDHSVTVEDIKELIDNAIAHVDRMTLSHLMDVLVSKRYDDDDFIIIREKDFLLDGKKQEKLAKKQQKKKRRKAKTGVDHDI